MSRIFGKANSNFQCSRFLGSFVNKLMTKLRVLETKVQQEIGSVALVGMWVFKIVSKEGMATDGMTDGAWKEVWDNVGCFSL